jgi:hypothetical protein
MSQSEKTQGDRERQNHDMSFERSSVGRILIVIGARRGRAARGRP